MLGKENPDTLTSLRNLAWALDKQCKYAESETFYRRAMEGRERMLGKENPTTLPSLDSLALALDRQHKSAKAKTVKESWARRILAHSPLHRFRSSA